MNEHTFLYRFRYVELGAHTHVRVFAGRGGSLSLGLCGRLTFRNDEWAAFMNEVVTVEFVRDE